MRTGEEYKQILNFHKGYGEVSAFLSPIFQTYTNLFLTLIPVNTVGKIVVKRAEDKH